MITFDKPEKVLDALAQKLEELRLKRYEALLNRYGNMGVQALSAHTPKDTGETSGSWSYTVKRTPSGQYTIAWSNSVMIETVPLVILLQYGHGTGTGGYVVGTDFINPAMEPVFKSILEGIKKEITL